MQELKYNMQERHAYLSLSSMHRKFPL